MIDVTNITMNFGTIKTVYNNLLSESVMSKNNPNKELFKRYVKLIKENEILKTQFLVFTNIENKVESNFEKASMFVKEHIDLFSKFTKEEILAANAKLMEGIVLENNLSRNDLYENISTLIFTKKQPNNIDIIVEATAKIVDYIVNNKPKVINESIDLPPNMVSTILVDKFNERYSTLNESDKKILAAMIDSTDDEKSDVYDNLLNECLVLINSQLVTEDLDLKEKLLRVKEKLLNDKKEINEDFIKNVSKLVELRDNLQ